MYAWSIFLYVFGILFFSLEVFFLVGGVNYWGLGQHCCLNPDWFASQVRKKKIFHLKLYPTFCCFICVFCMIFFIIFECFIFNKRRPGLSPILFACSFLLSTLFCGGSYEQKCPSDPIFIFGITINPFGYFWITFDCLEIIRLKLD